MENRIGLLCVGAGILAPVLLLVGGGYLTSTDAAEGCSLFFMSYGIGLLLPGILFLVCALRLQNARGLFPGILWVLFAIPGVTSFAAIFFKFSQWQNIFTIGQGFGCSIPLMFGIGLLIRHKRGRLKLDHDESNQQKIRPD